MATVFDYLNWRADLNPKAVPYTVIDALIFSRLAYLLFDEIVPTDFNTSIDLSSAGEQLVSKVELGEVNIDAPNDWLLLEQLIKTPRFSDIKLTGYRSQLDPELEKQFGALTLILPTGELFIAFRGTNVSLMGWKEDLNMSFMTYVPSQLAAVKYLEEVATALPGNINLGGHSKGGNLSVFAAAFTDVSTQARVKDIYSFDGPGFQPPVLEHAGYQAIKARIHTFVPQSSIVGMLLEHTEPYTVVHSTKSMVEQHDIYSWEVAATHFITEKSLTNSSIYIGQTIKDWAASVTDEQRGQFIDTLFDIARQAGERPTKSMKDTSWSQFSLNILTSYRNIDPEARKMVKTTLGLLGKAASENIQFKLPERKK